MRWCFKANVARFNSDASRSDSLPCHVGWAVQEKPKRGFLEEIRIGAELAVTAVFDAIRWVVTKTLISKKPKVGSDSHTTKDGSKPDQKDVREVSP